jgi:hypothetical protein
MEEEFESVTQCTCLDKEIPILCVECEYVYCEQCEDICDHCAEYGEEQDSCPNCNPTIEISGINCCEGCIKDDLEEGLLGYCNPCKKFVYLEVEKDEVSPCYESHDLIKDVSAVKQIWDEIYTEEETEDLNN